MARFKRVAEGAIAAALLLAMGGVAFGQLTGDEAVQKRRAEMVIVGRANGGIGAVARGASIDAATLEAVKGEADKIVTAFGVLSDPTLWPADSTHDNFASSKAKGEIWSNAEGFAAAMQASSSAAAALRASVDTGDLARIGEAQRALQATCGGCHTAFRT